MGFMARMMGEPDSDEDNFCNLSWETRLYGCATCFVIGVFLSIFGTIELWLGKWVAFGLLYTLGTLTALGGTIFLRGPQTQAKKMFEKDRLCATITLIASIIATILVAVLLQWGWLAMFCCIVQFIAFAWYTLSYIPYARSAVKSCFSGVTGIECPC